MFIYLKLFCFYFQDLYNTKKVCDLFFIEKDLFKECESFKIEFSLKTIRNVVVTKRV